MCCENIKGILTEAGVSLDRVVKVRLHKGLCYFHVTLSLCKDPA